MEKVTLIIHSWLRDILKLYFRYLGVGFSAIPAVIVYYFLLSVEINQKVALAFSLCIGLVVAIFIWRYIGKNLFQSKENQLLLNANVLSASQEPNTSPNLFFQLPQLPATATASFIVVAFGTLQPNQTKIIQPQVSSNSNSQSTAAPAPTKVYRYGKS